MTSKAHSDGLYNPWNSIIELQYLATDSVLVTWFDRIRKQQHTNQQMYRSHLMQYGGGGGSGYGFIFTTTTNNNNKKLSIAGTDPQIKVTKQITALALVQFGCANQDLRSLPYACYSWTSALSDVHAASLSKTFKIKRCKPYLLFLHSVGLKRLMQNVVKPSVH